MYRIFTCINENFRNTAVFHKQRINTIDSHRTHICVRDENKNNIVAYKKVRTVNKNTFFICL